MIEVNDVVNLNLNACCYTAEERSCMDGLKSTVTELRNGFVIGIDNNATQIILDEFDGGSSMTNDIQTAIRNGSTKFQMETKLLGHSLKMALGLDISPNPIQKVIFNAPATIVFWKDGSKTVVKAQGDEYDPEKGLAMAISRHYLCDVCGLERYDGIFNRYLPKDKN